MRSFAALSGFEAVARGMLISVFPLAVYEALQDAQQVSQAYFLIGLLSLVAGLMVPWANRLIPRRWLYTGGAAMFALGDLLALQGGSVAVLSGLALITVATVVLFVCLNAYVLDFVARSDLGESETLRMFYAALGWTLGPVAGVYAHDFWAPLPFLISAAAIAGQLTLFWAMRAGNGKQISRAKAPAANPLAFLARFVAQPRLVAGWLFAVIRSCGWWVYVVYLPIFAVEAGLGPKLGGAMLSTTNALLFATPLMLRLIRRSSIRMAVRSGFSGAAAMFVLAGIGAPVPVAAAALLALGSIFLIFLDICGGLPFLMAVKPSERTEMSAIYSSFRDISGILTPGAAALILMVAPLSGIFIAGGAALFAAWGIAGRLHPNLGRKRLTPEPAE